MFDNITQRFDSIFRNLRGLGKITDENIDSTTREIRRALLEADVNFIVAKDFVNRVKKSAQGTKVLKSIKPGEQFISMIHKELISVLGENQIGLNLSSGINVILLVGLQGSGKTTTASKLANKINSMGKKVSLIAADTYRPGAVDQLKQLGKNIDVPVFYDNSNNAIKICKYGIKESQAQNINTIIIDTAGRLHVDGEMMVEIQKIYDLIKPREVLFIADSMTGQDMISSIKTFDEALNLTGVVLTKLDGDARGGAALSIRGVTGVPIKFIGVSEKVDGLDDFNPKKIADKILGFGDIVSLVDKVEKVIKEEDVLKIEQKIANNSFDFNDFRDQLYQIRKMGSMTDLISMIPGISRKIKGLKFDENQLVWNEAIINSMTPNERVKPDIINSSRKKRIALGSGRTVYEINTLIKKFSEMKKMMKKMNNKQSKFSGKRLLRKFS
ncbi:MAG: signal recognition particle protein [bacterium TMED217]|nr:MAG: signal recognition particle protein [bacterium TMED217]|tara:strand:- start:13282 stop:14607 length:1326 start_codon:yes stop_codon:yes gene_type:complete